MKSTIKQLGAASLLLAYITPAIAQEAQPEAQATPPPAVQLDENEVTTEISYGLGYQAGRRAAGELSEGGLSTADVELEIYIEGLRKGFAEEELDPAKIARIESGFRILGERLQKKQQAEAAAAAAEATKFLEENRKKEGVVTTESGLQYEVLTKGEGKVYEEPKEGETPTPVRFMVHYKGTLIDGTEFDASPEGKAVPFDLNVVPGFREALLMMPEGSKWRLFLPPSLGYGEQEIPGRIPANSVLIFEVQLDSINEVPSPPAVPADQEGE